MYNLKQLAMMTGLTERTLRNYLRLGILTGEKVDGVWQFTKEQVTTFYEKRVVKSAMKATRNAIIYDFLSDTFTCENSICAILHLPEDKPLAVAEFFCDAVNQRKNLNMRFDRLKGRNQVILVGDLQTVEEILADYRLQNNS